MDPSLRYRALIRQALLDIELDPERPEIMIAGARTYHLSLSRTHVSGIRVKQPTHFLLYRRRDEWIEVSRILHDARELEQHLPVSYRRSE